MPLPPGLFVDAAVKGKTFEGVIVLPRDGLRPDNEIYVVDDKGKVEIRKAEVLDTNSREAYLYSGVDVGELVVLSPMEKSRVSMTLKVLDAKDPTKVLVDPPEPEWMKEMAKAKEENKEKKRGWGRKKDDDKKEGGSGEQSDTDKSGKKEGGDGEVSAATSESDE